MPRLCVARVKGKGRAVFTTEAIKKGEAVVTDCVLPLLKEDVEKAGPPLAFYPFAWNEKNSALALGLVSIASHSDQPNRYPERDFKNLLIRLVANRDIEAGEEITYDYKAPLWFEPKPPSRLVLKEN